MSIVKEKALTSERDPLEITYIFCFQCYIYSHESFFEKIGSLKPEMEPFLGKLKN